MQPARDPRPDEGRCRSLISIQDLRPEELRSMVDEGCALAADGTAEDYAGLLRGKVVGLYFRQPSTRTRTSFFLAVHRMGGVSIQYGPGDLQLENGESVGDTAMILDQVLEVLVARTNGPESELRALAAGSRNLSVINALSEGEHPTQAIADLITIQQEFGDLAGRHILYIGAANNTSGSLLLAASRIPGLRITMAEPDVFRTPAHVAELAVANARQSGAVVSFESCPEGLPAPVDVVYTARWQSMGKEPQVPGWRSILARWRIDERLMDDLGDEHTIFMHDLPASRGDEVTDAVMDGRRSRIRRQASNKTVSAMVTLRRMTGGTTNGRASHVQAR
jgi:ornithine carbamoyltransferase